MASAGARAYNGVWEWGQSPQRRSMGQSPGGGSGGRRADGILVLEHTSFCALLELVVVAISPKRPDRGVHFIGLLLQFCV